jgi:hypothetical protein
MAAFGTACEAAPFDSPVGVWDCVTSGGGQRGITYLTFSNDNTFSGFAMVAGMPARTVVNSSSRGGPDGRSDNSSLTAGTNTFVFGFMHVKGPWQFDSRGRVIGSFREILNATSLSTNYFATNVLESITNQANLSEVTNIVVEFHRGCCPGQETDPGQLHQLWGPIGFQGRSGGYGPA